MMLESMNLPCRTSYIFLVHLLTSSVLQLSSMAPTRMRAIVFIRSVRHWFLNGTKKHLYDISEISLHVSLDWNLGAFLRNSQKHFPFHSQVSSQQPTALPHIGHDGHSRCLCEASIFWWGDQTWWAQLHSGLWIRDTRFNEWSAQDY